MRTTGRPMHARSKDRAAAMPETLDFGRAGVVMKDGGRPLVADTSDFLFYGALAMLPVDGTTAGPYMPFWTPLSPWLFLLYAVVNWRDLPQVWHRFRVFFMFPLLLLALSVVDWHMVAFHRLPAMVSFSGVLGALACLVSLDVAVRIKRLSWWRMVDLVILVYWFAFAVGVVQRLAIQFDWITVRHFFVRLMDRQYITADSPWGGPRPQFLFAEPSYIGMHLYGVLLPLTWMVRGRDRRRANRLRALIVVFALGALLMGAGVRIFLDSAVALGVVVIEVHDWSSWRGRLITIGEMTLMAGIGAVAITASNRLTSIAEQGVDGDGSFYARLWQSLGPGLGALKHPVRMLLGYGAGNLSDATHEGARSAVRVLARLGMDINAPRGWYSRVTPANMFTMSAYTSFLVEFGLIAFAILMALVLWHVTCHHAWSKTTVCWLLLIVYLYVQFEGYAFYALPLFLWMSGCGRSDMNSTMSGVGAVEPERATVR